jgi:hypothetical protein
MECVREDATGGRGEDECCERPEWPIEVGRRREVSGHVRWQEGVEGVVVLTQRKNT